jgi:hypothetical protein
MLANHAHNPLRQLPMLGNHRADVGVVVAE